MSTNSENKWYINDAVQYIKDNNIPEEALKSLVINSPLYGQMSLMDAINSNLKGYWDANEMKDLIDKKHTSYQDQRHNSDQNQKPKLYPVFTGYGGMEYASSPEEQIEMQKQANLNKASDPSENFLNDLMVPGPKAAITVGKGLWSLGKGVYYLSKNLLQSIAKQGIKETGKRVAYQTGKELLKETPRFAGSIVGGYAVDKTSEALTGKTWGENASDFLSHRWGFNVPPVVVGMTNPGYYAGFKYGGDFLYHDLRKRIYRNMTPFGYINQDVAGMSVNHNKEIKNILKSYLNPLEFFKGTKETPFWMLDNDLSVIGVPEFGLTGEARAIFRDDAFRRALKLKPRSKINTYIENPDGTVSYNLDYINKIRKETGGREFDIVDFEYWNKRAGQKYVYGDVVTSNGGFVDAKLSDDLSTLTISDAWDLQPFKDAYRLPSSGNLMPKISQFMNKYDPNFEFLDLVNGNPFLLKQDFKTNF